MRISDWSSDVCSSDLAFQPLARIDQADQRSRAAEWIEGRLLMEGLSVGPDEKGAIWSALGSLATAPVEQRTLTGLSALLQSNRLRQALSPYVLGGAHGRLLDADQHRLGDRSEERRVGTECGRQCRSLWSPSH